MDRRTGLEKDAELLHCAQSALERIECLRTGVMPQEVLACQDGGARALKLPRDGLYRRRVECAPAFARKLCGCIELFLCGVAHARDGYRSVARGRCGNVRLRPCANGRHALT